MLRLTPVYNFFGSLMKYFGPVQLLDFAEPPGTVELSQVTHFDSSLNELFRMVRNAQTGTPKAINRWKSWNSYLFFYFCIHSAFTIIRIFQCAMNPGATAAINAATLMWTTVIGFSCVPYHAFVWRKRETLLLLKSWSMLEHDLLSGMNFYTNPIYIC